MRPDGSTRFHRRHLSAAILLAAVLVAGGYSAYSVFAHRSSEKRVDRTTDNNEGAETQFQQKLAARSPAEELAAAQRETDPEKRAAQLRAALQAWGRLAPDAATQWVLARPPEERLIDASVVLIALADRPSEAIRIGQRFCKEDPGFVREHGNSVLTVLTATGEFDQAVKFASLGGPERNEWVARAFADWTELAPSAAARAALAFENDDALSVVFATWAAQNPAAAARFTAGHSDTPTAQRAALTALAKGTGG